MLCPSRSTWARFATPTKDIGTDPDRFPLLFQSDYTLRHWPGRHLAYWRIISSFVPSQMALCCAQHGRCSAPDGHPPDIAHVPYAIVAAFIGIVFVVVNKIDRTKNDMVMDMPFVYVGSQDVFMLSLCYRVGKLFSDCVGFLTVHLSRFKRLYQMKG